MHKIDTSLVVLTDQKNIHYLFEIVLRIRCWGTDRSYFHCPINVVDA